MQSLLFYRLARSSQLRLRVAYGEASDGGKFAMDLQRSPLQLSRFVPRQAEWSTPFLTAVEPSLAMPDFDPLFALSFADVCDSKALEVKQRIVSGERFALMYSGGIDSTVILASLLKHLSAEELHSVAIVCNQSSIDEYPLMWERYIQDKLRVLDANTVHYDDLIYQGYAPITGDNGDCLFGTFAAIDFYNKYFDGTAPDDHYSVHKDKLIDFFGSTPSALPNFGELLYLKMERCAQTAQVPIHSVHDLFWWLIFDPKYVNCAMRGAIFFQHSLGIDQVMQRMENWFNDVRYQQWSMANNNNGQKIAGNGQSYKLAARQYIFDFTGDREYFLHKKKIASLNNVQYRHDFPATFAVTRDYQRIDFHTDAFHALLRENLATCQIDWT